MLDGWRDILMHVPAALLVIFRISGLMVFGPVLASSVVPVRMRVALAFLLGLAFYPLLVQSHPEWVAIPLDLWSLLPLVLMEITLGAAVGFIATLPLMAAQAGGLIMGQQMGLGFAQLYNPALEDEGDLVGQILFFMVLVGFIAIGGLEAMAMAVLRSFDHIALGGFAPDGTLILFLTGIVGAAFETALRVAAPLLALIFLETIALGFVSKSVPQLNILSLGFPLRILAGMFIIGSGLAIIDDVLIEEVDRVLHSLFTWVEQAGA